MARREIERSMQALQASGPPGVDGYPVQFGPWQGGVNYAATGDNTQPNELYAMLNTEVDPAGQCVKRPGFDVFNSSALNSAATVTALGYHEFTAASSSNFAIIGNKFYESLSGTPADRTGGLTITAGDDKTWHFADANGTLVGNNGVSGDALIKWTAAGGNIAALTVDSRFTWAKWWAWWDGRVWAANNSVSTDQTNYSSNSDIETWAATDYVNLTTDVTGIAPMGNEFLVIHGKDRVDIISPTNVSDQPYQRYARASYGTVSGRAIATVPKPGGGHHQVYPRRDGFYSFDGNGEARKISQRLDGERYWENVNKDRLFQSFQITYPRKNCVWFWIPYGSGQTNMNHVIIYDYLRNIFYGPYDGTGTVMERNAGALINDIPHAGGLSTGYVYKHETANNDDDNTTNNKIDGWFETSSIPPQGLDMRCRWYHAIIAHQATGLWSLNVTQMTPGISSNEYSFDMTGGFDAVGTTFTVGTSSIGGGKSTSLEEMRLEGYDPYSMIKVRNAEASQHYKIRSITQVFKPLGKHRNIHA